MTRILTIVAVIAALAGGGYLAFKSLGGPAAINYDAIPTAKVEKGRFERAVSSIGEMKAARSTLVAAPYEAKVVKLIEEGSRVEVGDPMVWLETTTMEEQLEEKKNELRIAEKDLEAAREEYKLQELQNHFSLQSENARLEIAEQRYLDSQQKFEAERILVEKSISPQSKLDEAQLAMLQSGVELRNARINLRKTEENLSSNLRIRQTNIDKQALTIEKIKRDIQDYEGRLEAAVIKAPTAGEVSFIKIWRSGTSSKVAEGDNVWPRSNLMEIPDRSQMNAVVPINELDIAQIEPGQQAIVRLDAVPGRTFEGVVQRKSIVPISDQNRRAWDEGSTSGPREFEVEIRMTGSNDLFRQGMTASVRVIVASAEDALIVPLEAITIRDGELGVWRRSVLGAEFVPIKVELTNDLSAAVQAALEPGDELFLRDPAGTIEDARIDTRAALARIKKDATPLSSPSPAATNGGDAGDPGSGRGSGNRPRETGNAAPAASTTPGA